MTILIVVRASKVCGHAKCHDPTFTGAILAPTSEVSTFSILEWLKLRD
jgi:hypothetical protein